MKKVLVINLGWEQEPLLNEISKRGVEIYGVHYDDNYIKSVKYSDILISDLRDLQTILEFAKKIEPDAVISDGCDYSHFIQAVVCDVLNLNGPSIIDAQISSNKYLQRLLSKKKDIKIPKFALCKEVKDAKEFTEKYSFPCIVKPIDNRGSFGVNRVNSSRELDIFFTKALLNSHSRLVIIEEFIDGVHLTVDGYCFSDTGATSLTIAEKELPLDGKQIAMNIHYPANFNKNQFTKILDINSEVNRKLGYSFGMIHSEYMLKDNELYLIESANRGGGVYTSELIVPNVTDIDLLKLYVDDALETKHSKYILPKQNSVSLCFFNFQVGKVKSIKYKRVFSKYNSIISHKIDICRGDEIKQIESDASRHGFVIIKDKNPNKIFDTIKKEIEVNYE